MAVRILKLLFPLLIWAEKGCAISLKLCEELIPVPLTKAEQFEFPVALLLLYEDFFFPKN